jgi:hypothetical protein
MKHHQEMLPVMISSPTFDHGDWVCWQGIILWYFVA